MGTPFSHETKNLKKFFERNVTSIRGHSKFKQEYFPHLRLNNLAFYIYVKWIPNYSSVASESGKYSLKRFLKLCKFLVVSSFAREHLI
jgi:hypothetical protein